jgi:phospholipid/cholesterol/gamma-HCH transport system permease protein
MPLDRPTKLDWTLSPDGVLRLAGALDLRAVAGQWPALSAQAGNVRALDLSGLTRLDTAGAYVLVRLSQGGALALDLPRSEQAELLARVVDAAPQASPAPRPHLDLSAVLTRVGRSVAGAGLFAAELATMLGLVLVRLAQCLRHPRQMPLTALVHHADQVGLRAVPIVSLMAFLIGVVLAFQGAVQLRQFGAEIYVVDLIAISILRELGILLTAIIVAGRSASAFTAAIGSMNMREEIDAMRVLGLNPVDLLVLPRLLALVIVLPILGLVADLAGLFGGALMAWTQLGISPSQFRTQLLADVSATQALVGLSKAPVFAAIIALVGCRQGFLVKGDAESLGMRTSRSVVIAIFLVIVVDALFSVFFALWEV